MNTSKRRRVVATVVTAPVLVKSVCAITGYVCTEAEAIDERTIEYISRSIMARHLNGETKCAQMLNELTAAR